MSSQHEEYKFQVGNQLWKVRFRHGRTVKYTPTALLKKAFDYFDWCDQNPLIKKDFIRGGSKAGTIIDIPVPRLFTLTGLCIHLNIYMNTFENYSRRPEYTSVTARIREIILTQKFECVAAGIFSGRVISRDLGLINKQETGLDGGVEYDIVGMIVK